MKNNGTVYTSTRVIGSKHAINHIHTQGTAHIRNGSGQPGTAWSYSCYLFWMRQKECHNPWEQLYFYQQRTSLSGTTTLWIVFKRCGR